MTKRKKAAPAWRRVFLRALKRTGNVRAAAAEAGVDHGTAYNHRRRDAGFAGGWERALRLRSEQAEGRGKGAPSPHRARPPAPAEAGEDLVLRNSKRHGAQLVKAGKGRWSGKAEAAFLAALGETGSLRRAARAAGFSTTTIHNRLIHYPGFAAAAQAAVRMARADLESLVLSAGLATFDPEGAGEEDTPLPKVSVAEAIAFLRLTPSAKGAKAARGEPEGPKIEEVRANILRKLDAIEAAERRRAAGSPGA